MYFTGLFSKSFGFFSEFGRFDFELIGFLPVLMFKDYNFLIIF